jgi:hypothetical protein
MTVKATLAYGKNFHFYHEALDNNHVYLELEDVSYDASYRRVMVAIPIDVWEVIRWLGVARLDLINVPDDELIRLVEDKVDDRVAEHEKARAFDCEQTEQVKLTDYVEFGPIDSTREQQISRGLDYYKMERERQREISIRIAQHKIIDINTGQLEAKD